jgi:hypothetical protein
VGDAVKIDFGAWEEHAGWWDAEAEQARQRLSVDTATLAQARTAFGKIGSSTVGAALADTLQERHAAGQPLGDYAQGVAGHIRSSLDAYRGAERDNKQRLRDDAGAAGEGRKGGGPTVQAVDFKQSPADQDPPHGKDPRYWIDVTKIIHVPDGKYAPYGTTQIGPGLYYPTGTPYQSNPAPDPARFPVDASKIMYYPPEGPLPPYGTTELAPGYYTYTPGEPGSMIPPSSPPSWPAPQQPIDVRDVIHVPEGAGAKAPWGYVEYLPEWFAPGPELTNTP